MGESAGFKDKQYAFANHIRDPDNNPAPAGAEDRRMAVYRDLFFNNLRNLLSQTFPVLRKLHTPERWDQLVRGFMVEHKAQTPYFLEIPQEFQAWLQGSFEPQEGDYPFLVELAHYEWVELALSVSELDNDMEGIDADGDLLDGIPVKSALAWAFAYQYPVHRISADFLPEKPSGQPTFLAVCRKANDDMDFMELNPVTARLLELVEGNDNRSGRQLLEDLAGEIGYPDVEAFVAHGSDALRQMRDAEIVIGVK